MQYIALIHKNCDTDPTPVEWERLFKVARETGMFQGGTEIGRRIALGQKDVPDTTSNIGGYMRFDSNNLDTLLKLLELHPAVQHGGTLELCEMPES